MPPAQCKDDSQAVRDLEMEVKAMETRCDGYERVIKDLQSRCDTHENALEMLRQQIVHLHNSQGTLSTMYRGENYDLIP